MQTAQALRRPYETSADVGTGASAESVLAAVRWPAAGGAVLVVGHQPTLGRIAALLVEGEERDRSLAKGAVSWLCGPDRSDRVVVKAEITPESL